MRLGRRSLQNTAISGVHHDGNDDPAFDSRRSRGGPVEADARLDACIS
jgi:hypothetical protein